MQTWLLNIFTLIALMSAIMVIASKNPIHSVVFLILVFCNATGLLLLLKIEFIAMMFLIIYVGAIAVLFLFVVMMLNIKINELNENWGRYLPIGGVLSIIFLLQLFIMFQGRCAAGGDYLIISNPNEFSLYVNGTALAGPATQGGVGTILQHNQTISETIKLFQDFYLVQKPWTSLVNPMTNIQSLGVLVYTYHFFYFIMASIILLVAMIGAIVLTMHKRKYASKKQLIYKQISRNFTQAISLSYTR